MKKVKYIYIVLCGTLINLTSGANTPVNKTVFTDSKFGESIPSDIKDMNGAQMFKVLSSQVNSVISAKQAISKNASLLPKVKSMGVAKTTTNNEIPGGLLFKPGFKSMNTVWNYRDSCVQPLSPSELFEDTKSSIRITSSEANGIQERSSVVKAALSAGYGIYSADASMSAENSSLFNTNSVNIKYMFTARAKHKALFSSNALLTPQSAELLKNNRPEFILKCGDSFVWYEQAGVELNMILTLISNNEEAVQKFNSSLTAGAASIASVTAALENATKDSKSSFSLKVDVFQHGGNPLLLPGSLSHTSCEDKKSCDEILKGVNTYAEKSLSKQVFDEQSGKPKVNLISYSSPELIKYSIVSPTLTISDQSDPENDRAIKELEDLYTQTLLLLYKLEPLAGDNAPVPSVKIDLTAGNGLFTNLKNREIYLSFVGKACYADNFSCKKEMKTIKSTLANNSMYKIDEKELRFYTTEYQINNYLNMGKLYQKDVNILFDPIDYAAKNNFDLLSNRSALCTDNSKLCNPYHSELLINNLKSVGNKLELEAVNNPFSTQCVKTGTWYHCDVINSTIGKEVLWKETIKVSSPSLIMNLQNYVNPQ